MVGSARADIRLFWAADDEKDLSTAQPPPFTDARISRAHGHAGGEKYSQTPPRKGACASDHHDSSQTARLDRRRLAVVTSSTAGFGRADRLHRSGEFVALQRRGTRYQSEHFVLYGGPGGATGERARLGITVSGRIGNAVVRNRLKRRVRECYRQKLRAMLPAGVEIVVIARRGAGELRWTAIDAELEAGVANLGRRLGGNSDIRQGDLQRKSMRVTERGRD